MEYDSAVADMMEIEVLENEIGEAIKSVDEKRFNSAKQQMDDILRLVQVKKEKNALYNKIMTQFEEAFKIDTDSDLDNNLDNNLDNDVNMCNTYSPYVDEEPFFIEREREREQYMKDQEFELELELELELDKD